jgi:glutaminyl-peptide cyclotransferase
LIARQWRSLALAIAVGAIAVGCAGESEKTSSAAPPSKAEFIERANAACARERAGVGERVSAYLRQLRSEGKPSEVRYADLAHFVLLPTIEAEIVRINELKVPHGDEKRVEEMVYAERVAIDEVATTTKVASIEVVENHFIKSGKLFRAYGLSSCANGPQEKGKEGRFNSNGAWRLIERQLSAGQRPAGSPQLRELAGELRPLLPAGRFEAIPGEPRLRNVVGTLRGIRPAIVLAAHYDTLRKPRGFLGANNGAAGTAIVIQAARALRSMRVNAGAHEVRFVLFDGEEPSAGLPEEGADFYHEGLRGSRAYADAHHGQTQAMILLDYVANRGLFLPREATSSKELWGRLVSAAKAEGAGEFFSLATGPAIIDDHTPFLRAKVPAIDLIDWRYPGHSLADGLDKLSRRSINAVGETVVRLIDELRRE